MQGWSLRAAQTLVSSADESEAKFSQRYKHSRRAQTRPAGPSHAPPAPPRPTAGSAGPGGSGTIASAPSSLTPITENPTGVNRSCLTACFWTAIFFCHGPVLGRIPFQLARRLVRRNKQTNKQTQHPNGDYKGWQDNPPQWLETKENSAFGHLLSCPYTTKFN